MDFERGLHLRDGRHRYFSSLGRKRAPPRACGVRDPFGSVARSGRKGGRRCCLGRNSEAGPIQEAQSEKSGSGGRLSYIGVDAFTKPFGGSGEERVHGFLDHEGNPGLHDMGFAIPLRKLPLDACVL